MFAVTMNKYSYLVVFSFILTLTFPIDCQTINSSNVDDPIVGSYYKPGITAGEILEARGFLVKEFEFTTRDNYILSIIRARNPLINNGRGGLKDREPLVFIHGILVSAATWVTLSQGAEPRDFTNIQVNTTSEQELIKLVGDDPGTFALPILFMNFGHEVWILNRRGTLQSLDRVGSRGRTLVDAFKSIVPSLFGAGFGPNNGLGVINFGSFNTSNYVNNSMPLNLTADQEKQLANFDDQKLTNLLGSTPMTLNYTDLLLRGLQFQDKSLINQFLLPIINLPEALLGFGTLVERFIRTFDAKYWSFTLDEQVTYDFPAVIDFVLKQTGRKQVSVISHSAGAGMTMLALSERPELADKIAKAVVLAPALNLGHKDIGSIFFPLSIPFQAYLGPFPFLFLVSQIRGIIQVLCNNPATQCTLCEGIADLFFGASGAQQPITPGFLAAVFEPIVGREFIQLGQFVVDTRPRKYNFNSPDQNLKVYGTFEPPYYDLSRIRLQKLSIFTSVSDLLVSPQDVLVTMSQLSVPTRLYNIGSDEIGTFFNHGGYFTHNRVNVLANIPILREIEYFLN